MAYQPASNPEQTKDWGGTESIYPVVSQPGGGSLHEKWKGPPSSPDATHIEMGSGPQGAPVIIGPNRTLTCIALGM